MQTVSHHRYLLHRWNGLFTAILVLAYAAWVAYLMNLRTNRTPFAEWVSSQRIRYLVVALGLAITVALVLLHGEFATIIFADIGIIGFTVEWRVGLSLTVLLGALFMYAVGIPQSDSLSQIAGNLIGLVSTVALVYTLVAVFRQRLERDRLIGELREAHGQLQVSAAREVELAALRERNRLAREMHDSLGHALVLIAIKIEAAQRLQEIDPGRATLEWEETKALVRSTMGELRSSLAGLRLPALEEQSFSSAIDNLTQHLAADGNPGVAVFVHAGADALPRPAQQVLYRVAQEGLANVAKHARARHVSVAVEVTDGAALLEICDDGVGLDGAAHSGGGHYGVMGMRERVEALGGALTLGPAAGGGTRLHARVPIEEVELAGHTNPAG